MFPKFSKGAFNRLSQKTENTLTDTAEDVFGLEVIKKGKTFLLLEMDLKDFGLKQKC